MRRTTAKAKPVGRPRRIGIGLLGAAALWACLPAFGADVQPYTQRNSDQPTAPGTLNYVQGTVLLDGNPMSKSNIGSTELGPDQVLATRAGKAEVMLDPGVYLRLDDQTKAKMLSTDITPSRVEVDHGEIGIEVDELHPQNVLQVVDDGVTTQLLKKGYYEFNANSPNVEVFSGKAEVSIGDGIWKQVKARHEMALTNVAQAQPRGFQPNAAEDPMMAWSKLRTQYLDEANRDNNPYYYGDWGWGPGWGGWGPGWGWAGPGWGWRGGWGWGWGWGW